MLRSANHGKRSIGLQSQSSMSDRASSKPPVSSSRDSLLGVAAPIGRPGNGAPTLRHGWDPGGTSQGAVSSSSAPAAGRLRDPLLNVSAPIGRPEPSGSESTPVGQKSVRSSKQPAGWHSVLSSTSATSSSATSRSSSFAPSRLGMRTGSTDGRGKYDRARAGVGQRVEHAEQAWQHIQSILGQNGYSFGTKRRSACPFKQKCGLQFAPARLLRAHEMSYGSSTDREELEGRNMKYTCEIRTKVRYNDLHSYRTAMLRCCALIWVSLQEILLCLTENCTAAVCV